jgi:hypothetical protein
VDFGALEPGKPALSDTKNWSFLNVVLNSPPVSKLDKNRHLGSVHNRNVFALSAAELEPFQLVEPIDTLVIDPAELALQQDMQAPVAPARTVRGQGPQALANLRLIGGHLELIPHGRPMRANQPARTTLREPRRCDDSYISARIPRGSHHSTGMRALRK